MQLNNKFIDDKSIIKKLVKKSLYFTNFTKLVPLFLIHYQNSSIFKKFNNLSPLS